MKNYLIIFFLVSISVSPQTTSFDFYSPENIKKFADHLFCEADYLRAIEQYGLISKDCTTDFKVMLGYSLLNLYQESNEIFKSISEKSKFYSDAYLLSLKNSLLMKPASVSAQAIKSFDSIQLNSFNKLKTISMLFDDELSISKDKFISPFDENDINTVSLFYDMKTKPLYKSPALAGVMSAVIPGSGKMYVGEWGDGITAFLATGLLAFLAYDNFRADHTTRAWIFTGLGTFFYAGNIYGSIASAQIFNAKINFEFNEGLKLFLEQKNYFLPEYDFCK